MFDTSIPTCMCTCIYTNIHTRITLINIDNSCNIEPYIGNTSLMVILTQMLTYDTILKTMVYADLA